MQIFETVEIKITNRKTGETITQKEKRVVGSRCDYSGRLIDDYKYSYCDYRCDYGSQDPCFGASGEEYMFGKLHEINMHNFMDQTYEFYDDTHDVNIHGSEEEKMIKEMATMDFPTLESAFRFFRLRAAKRLIDRGIIHPDDLKENL